MIPFRLSARLQPRSRSGAPAAPVVPVAPVAPVGRAPRDAGGRGAGTAGDARARDAGGAIVAPWRIAQRSGSGVIEVENTGASALHAVRFSLAGAGLLGLSLPRTVLSGERLRVAVRGTRAEAAAGAPDSLLVLRWFAADGRELLWPVSLT